MTTQTETPVSPLALWRLAASASMASVTPDVLEASVRAGQIPGCSIVELGARGIKHIRRPDVFYAWLRNEPLPAADIEDLFRAAPATL